MKKIVFIGTCSLLTACTSGFKYDIIDSAGNHHHTNLYTKGDDGCIKFQESCGCGSDDLQNVTLCGSYTVKENQIYQP